MTANEPQARQASAVAIDGRAVLIEGPPGCGKSTLALALIDRGACLIGDDGVMLRRDGSEILVEPHPNVSGKLEIRGVGIAEFPVTSAPAALLINLGESGARLPDPVPRREVLGARLPCLALGGSDPASLPLRVEWALRIHGLAKEQM